MTFGVQTFTIRKEQKKNIEKAYLPQIEMGIREFEVARIDFNQETAKKLKEMVDKYRIRIVSIQVKPKYVFGHAEDVIEFCKITDCKRVVISQLPFDCVLGKEQKFYDFLSTLDPQYDVYKKQGIELAYHHHNWEYITLSNGKTRMEELLAKTCKIKFVHDTYWTTKCGLSSARQVEQFGNRLMGIHLRDLTLYKKGIDVLSKDAAVGEGVVDFVQVLTEAEKVGCEYYVIEQKTKTPYEDIRRSYENCNKIKIRVEEKLHEE